MVGGDAPRRVRAPVVAFYPGPIPRGWQVLTRNVFRPVGITRVPGGERLVSFRPEPGPWDLVLAPPPPR